MSHSTALKDLLFSMRQHAGFQELLRAVQTPQLPRFKRSEKKTIEEIGAETLFASGQLEQHKSWLTLLTGSPIAGDDNAV